MNAVATTARQGIAGTADSKRLSQRGFLVITALLFAASVAVTITWSTSMSAMDGMPMPGGWTMSMSWMRMQGQTWPGAAASFLGMWSVMMVAMMSPSLLPILRRYRQHIGAAGEMRSDLLTLLAATGYFFVWTVFGLAVFLSGMTLAAIEMQWPALARLVPIMAGGSVLTAGLFQFGTWKARQLACYRAMPSGLVWPVTVTTAWRYGVRVGLHCSYCCANLMLILLVVGIMDLRVMAIVTAAITAERLLPAGLHIARAVGVVAVVTGLIMIVQVVGSG